MRTVGIDVSKAYLDVCVRPSGDTLRVSNTDTGITQVVDQLKDVAPEMVVVEATGGLETALSAALLAALVPVVVIQPPPGERLRQGYRKACKERHY